MDHYGCWVTRDGEIIDVNRFKHTIVAEENGFTSSRNARMRGWTKVTYQHDGSYPSVYLGADLTPNHITALTMVIKDEFSTKIMVVGQGSMDYRFASTLRGALHTLKQMTT